MANQYRRLAVFVDNPKQGHFLWIVLESTDDPAVWLDLKTGEEAYETWIAAFEAGNRALLVYVDNELAGPTRSATDEQQDMT
ncbi:MAG: hypothetical protein EOP20_01845 [Hyphomicrobiales bacterium]|nr:MAG: hypothetical protein EOP20_01845 [Hyphomicrobiales bacterium]